MTFSADWLALREPADAAARSRELAELIRLPGHAVIRDLGAGTGSMGRWLAPLLSGKQSGEQHWILHDRDPELLAAARLPVSWETAAGGLPAEFAGTSLVTASALLDLLDTAQLDALATGCVAAGCPALLTLTVIGEVRFTPADPLDAELEQAFNAHQRRHTGLGPDAAAAAADSFARAGARVHRRPSPWRIEAPSALAGEWLRGWVSAAVEYRPELAGPAEEYLAHRLATPFSVTVGHEDLLAIPEGGPA
ncbi:hypothetical protein [Sciscionella sediminilitoris]|uniref:hypothetical protein n=1 Tax=Sciscionella sediminilitoris TaxID=1445613 RepID=UPI0004DF552E|nr:hypothetical protein [Sciscionella sp. SE31]